MLFDKPVSVKRFTEDIALQAALTSSCVERGAVSGRKKDITQNSWAEAFFSDLSFAIFEYKRSSLKTSLSYSTQCCKKLWHTSSQ